MSSALKFVFFIALISPTIAFVIPVSTQTSSLEDYTFLVGRQMQSDLDISELELVIAKARHIDRIESIAIQQTLVLQEVQQLDNNLIQQQAFSSSRKFCVKKHKPALETLNKVNANFTLCLYNAENSAEGLTSKAEASLDNAKRIREDELPKTFTSCSKNYSEISNIEICVMTKVNELVTLFNTNIDLFEIQLRESIYMSSVIASEATHCSFVVENEVLTSNGAVLSMIDVCEKNMTKSHLKKVTDKQ